MDLLIYPWASTGDPSQQLHAAIRTAAVVSTVAVSDAETRGRWNIVWWFWHLPRCGWDRQREGIRQGQGRRGPSSNSSGQHMWQMWRMRGWRRRSGRRMRQMQ